CRTHDSARRRPHGLCRRAHLRRLGAHRPPGYGEWYRGEGATFGAYPRVVDPRHRQRPRLVQRVLFRGRSMAPSRARRASTANRCVAHPALGFGRRKWISRTRGACRARRHMVWPACWRVKLTKQTGRVAGDFDFRRSLRRATIVEFYWDGRTPTRSERKSSFTLQLFARSVGYGRNSDQVFRVSIWSGKGVLTLSAGAAMTHWNFCELLQTDHAYRRGGVSACRAVCVNPSPLNLQFAPKTSRS